MLCIGNWCLQCKPKYYDHPTMINAYVLKKNGKISWNTVLVRAFISLNVSETEDEICSLPFSYYCYFLKTVFHRRQLFLYSIKYYCFKFLIVQIYFRMRRITKNYPLQKIYAFVSMKIYRWNRDIFNFQNPTNCLPWTVLNTYYK